MKENSDYSILLQELEYVKCDLCEEDNAEVLFQKRGTLTGVLFNIVRCRNDGLIYVNPRISKKGLPILYNKQYYSGRGFDHTVNYSGDIINIGSRESLRKQGMSKHIAELARSLGSPGRRFLDIGCGNGQVLEFMMHLGFEVYGVDVSAEACSMTHKRGLDTYCGEVTDDSFPYKDGNFTIIAALEVLEHLHKPKDYLQRIRSLLAPSGLFYYTTGNAEAINVEGENWDYLNPEGHIYYFSNRVMEVYFSQVGLQPLCPYEYPPFYTMHGAASIEERMRNLAKYVLLRSGILRRYILQPYLKVRNFQLMPLAMRSIE